MSRGCIKAVIKADREVAERRERSCTPIIRDKKWNANIDPSAKRNRTEQADTVRKDRRRHS